MSFGDRLLKSIMGNAVRIQNEISKVAKQDTPSNCTACGVHFHLIHTRRRQCSKCRDYFCGACLIRISSIQSSRPFSLGDPDSRVCNKCRVFASPNYSWDQLMQLKVRDLVWFLEQRQVNTEGLKEKEQLVEVIMNLYGSDRYLEAQARRQQRVAVMTCNMQSEFPSSGAQPRSDEDQDDDSGETETTREPPTHPPPPSPLRQQPQAPSPSPAPPRPPPQYVPTRGRSPSASPSHSQTSNQTVAVQDSVPSTPLPHAERVLLIDFKSCDDVEALSVKQLKQLLASNHVNYRGCCEKSELVSKAKQLVRSHLDNVRKLAAFEESEAATTGTSGGGNEETTEDDICKICMDALIDCVLLECGHMVTCLDCGKRMAECPICRQYVVRAVRIFKA